MSTLAVESGVRLEASEPPEARGLTRDGVRLLVADRADGSIVHGRFADLPLHLAPGDLIVVNTSATMPAVLPAVLPDGTSLELHLSTPANDRDKERFWIVELRFEGEPFGLIHVGDRLTLPDGGFAQILAPYSGVRLWLARLDFPQPLETYLDAHGHPIRYGYVPRRWPLTAY